MTLSRGTVTADTPVAIGGEARVLIDGAETAVTATGLDGYKPKPNDRVLIDTVATEVFLIEVLSGSEIQGRTITGGKFRTAASGQRWEIDSAAQNEIRGYSANAGEIAPGKVIVDFDAVYGGPVVRLKGASFDDGFSGNAVGPQISVLNPGAGFRAIEHQADQHFFARMDGITLLEITTSGIVFGTVPVIMNGVASAPAFGWSRGGQNLNSMDWGNANLVATSAAGRVTINHNLSADPTGDPITPENVLVTARTGHQFRVVSWTATQFVVECYTLAGVILGAGVNVSFFWEVKA